MSASGTHCLIVPPHILRSIADKGTSRQQEFARRAIVASDQQRAQRVTAAGLRPLAAPAQAAGRGRTVFDAKSGTTLPGERRRAEGDPPSGDTAVDQAYDGAGHTHDLFHEVYERRSLDGKGMRLDSTVHYGQSYDNAFWNGRQMVYGDGDEDLPVAERLFNRFTASLDVIGHELTHGVVQFTAGLAYQNQPGALNESFADVFGVLVRQRHLNQTADQADWLIGKGLLTANVHGEALRSLKAPGTAYDDPVIGSDPQPAHMRDFKDVTYDNGGVHINSGIPNHAFYLAAREIGGFAWEKAGRIWYGALTHASLGEQATFAQLATLTVQIAGTLFGDRSAEQQAVRSGWAAVGVEQDSPPPVPETPPGRRGCLVALATLGLVH